MMVPALLAILVSGALLILLGRSDPKRLRNLARVTVGPLKSTVLPTRVRRLCAWLVIAPGVALIALEQWWPFLIWLGATIAFGWLMSQLLAVSKSRGKTTTLSGT